MTRDALVRRRAATPTISDRAEELALSSLVHHQWRFTGTRGKQRTQPAGEETACPTGPATFFTGTAVPLSV